MDSIILTSTSKSTLRMLIQLAKKLGVKVEMLKDTNSPNLETRKAIEELESGKGKTYENLEDLMKDLNS